MQYSIEHIARIIDSDNRVHSDNRIEQLLIDSRKVHAPATSLFFALKGPRRDGHQFIPDLYKKGVRNFVTSLRVDPQLYPEAIFLQVYDTLSALQSLAAYHRQQFNIPVVGITGSNGKTIVKEWIYQLLSEEHHIVRSPKSYNSQVGVPLSVWQISEQHDLGIFEAGISQQGEMNRLERIIQPTVGILTNIGDAHSEGFNDDDHKFREKLSLFKGCKVIIGREADFSGRKEMTDMLGEEIKLLTWGTEQNCYFNVNDVRKSDAETQIKVSANGVECSFNIPFTDEASIENAITCCCYLLLLKKDPAIISKRMQKLHPVNMRLELKKGINQCIVINDSYSSDTSSLEIALSFLEQQGPGINKTVILSDLLHNALPDDELYEQVLEMIRRHPIGRIIGIGEKISEYMPALIAQNNMQVRSSFFSSTDSFLDAFLSSQFKDEIILVKGARVFGFERIVQLLEQKAHQTVLEINLSALAHNLKEFQHRLDPSVKVMAMVKAFAYGSGGSEIAGILQYHKVDYLGVAYADEGVELRKSGIRLPVMVMNPEINAFDKIVEHELEPELYSFEILDAFESYLRQEGIEEYPVHIEIETGMNRLGFAVADAERLADSLNGTPAFKVKSVFSHLAASEEAVQDEFTRQQFDLFNKAAEVLKSKLKYDFLKHIANSAAAIRHSYLHLDMVRLGIGLYGVDSSASGKINLQTVATLRSTIAQLKNVRAGESVSYNRKGIAGQDSVIATVRLGYADGYPRRLGNGVGKVWIGDRLVPVIGTICMDMFMADVTGIPNVREGDEVIIFGSVLPVEQVAAWAQTIPYEIMTGISQRVKRVYYEE